MAKAKAGFKRGGDQGRAKATTAPLGGLLSGNLKQKKPAIAKSTTQPSLLKGK